VNEVRMPGGTGEVIESGDRAGDLGGDDGAGQVKRR
jgi:hypothetical protein